MDDHALLSGIPEFFSLGDLLKATPSVEAGARIIYVEASKESKDQMGEIVLRKALFDSADVFRKFGVVDLDHKSMPSVAKAHGIEYPEEWILGQPLEISFTGKTIVKAQLRQGDTALAHRANMVWDGLTKLNPPDRYYASVGGSVTGRKIVLDPETGDKVPVITGTRWNNLALSLNPVHGELDAATTTPIGVFTKSLGGYVITKALGAGDYGTSAVGKVGGAALGMQSLDTGGAGHVHSYFDFRYRLFEAMKNGSLSPKSSDEALVRYGVNKFSLSHDDAAEWVGRLIDDGNDFKTSLKTQRSNT